MWFRSLGQEDPLERGLATDSSILAWTIPWTEEPGEPQGHKGSDTTDATEHTSADALVVEAVGRGDWCQSLRGSVLDGTVWARTSPH